MMLSQPPDLCTDDYEYEEIHDALHESWKDALELYVKIPPYPDLWRIPLSELPNTGQIRGYAPPIRSTYDNSLRYSYREKGKQRYMCRWHMLLNKDPEIATILLETKLSLYVVNNPHMTFEKRILAVQQTLSTLEGNITTFLG